MCDYSLEAYQSRPARAGEQYQLHYFPSHGVGFIAPGDPQTAVCMACDTKLKLENIPVHVQHSLKVGSEEEVTFVRLEMGPFHDGVRFMNGAETTLQQLGAGVKGSVIDEVPEKVMFGSREKLVHV